MKNYRAVIRDTLKSVQSDIPYDIKMAFPESKPAGNLITFYEITNTGTAPAGTAHRTQLHPQAEDFASA